MKTSSPNVGLETSWGSWVWSDSNCKNNLIAGQTTNWKRMWKSTSDDKPSDAPETPGGSTSGGSSSRFKLEVSFTLIVTEYWMYVCAWESRNVDFKYLLQNRAVCTDHLLQWTRDLHFQFHAIEIFSRFFWRLQNSSLMMKQLDSSIFCYSAIGHERPHVRVVSKVLPGVCFPRDLFLWGLLQVLSLWSPRSWVK